MYLPFINLHDTRPTDIVNNFFRLNPITGRTAIMIDKQAICGRFFSCYGDYSRRGLAKILGVRQPTVTEWSSGGRVPWNKLKYLSDSQGVSWDWLIDGIEPKWSRKNHACRIQPARSLTPPPLTIGFSPFFSP